MYKMKKLTIDLGDYSGSKKKSTQLEAAINAVGQINTKHGMMKHKNCGMDHEYHKKKFNIDIDLDD